MNKQIKPYSADKLIQNFEGPMLLCIGKYSDKSFSVSGHGTVLLRQQMKKLGGRFNSKINGWVFSNDDTDDIKHFLQLLVDETESSCTITSPDKGYNLVIKKIDKHNYCDILNQVNHLF